MSAGLERLRGKQFLLVTGKGGVGKTTLSAAAARLVARSGRRVLLLETDPRESLCHLLDVPPSGGEIAKVAPRLYLQNLRPRAVLDRFIRDHVHVGFLARRMLGSSVYEHFVEGAPGLKELAVLDYVHRLVEGRAPRGTPPVEMVILDAPATGHGLALLDAPRLVADVIHEGPFGRRAAALASFVGDPDRCGVVVTAFAEEMPVQEAIELIDALDERLQREPELVVVNRLYPPTKKGTGPEPADRLQTLWIDRRAVNDRELRRLGRHWSGPQVELPLLPIARGTELVGALAEQLEERLAEPPC